MLLFDSARLAAHLFPVFAKLSQSAAGSIFIFIIYTYLSIQNSHPATGEKLNWHNSHITRNILFGFLAVDFVVSVNRHSKSIEPSLLSA